ncbi:MAG TPA: TRAP transporter TatT component family protein [Pyrinomonadaceae bacterium]|nr:TRAP transporter TatT component family protein [Pyrinomonadaceae bacterium]
MAYSHTARRRLWLSLFAAAPLCLMLISCSSRRQETPGARAENRGPTESEVTAQADRLWGARENLERVRESVVLLRHARAADPRSYETAWRLSRAAYRIGAYGTDENDRDTAFREGIASGEAAVRIAPGRAEGHFWLGANIGGRTELQGAIGSLAAVEDVRREMEAVIKIDESFQSGSAYMALGQVDLKLPKMLGGDPQRAVEYLEKGLRFGERNALLRLRLAEAYLAVKRKEDARQQLNSIFTMTPNPDYLPEYKEAVARAQTLLEKTR